MRSGAKDARVARSRCSFLFSFVTDQPLRVGTDAPFIILIMIIVSCNLNLALMAWSQVPSRPTATRTSRSGARARTRLWCTHRRPPGRAWIECGRKTPERPCHDYASRGSADGRYEAVDSEKRRSGPARLGYYRSIRTRGKYRAGGY